MQLVLIIAVIVINKSCFASNEDGWRWQWTCDVRTEKCRRTPEPTPMVKRYESVETLHYASLGTCRLVCGRYGALWPKPTGHTSLSRQLLPFHPNSVDFQISNVDNKTKQYLIENTKIFRGNLLSECGANCSSVYSTEVTIFLTTFPSKLSLKWDTNETYQLDIVSKGNLVRVDIVAENVYGIRHGLETLTQLTASYPIYHKHEGVSHSLAIVSSGSIHDRPFFSHRGVLLDTARNYLPLSAIKRQIDAMSASKLNVLHWHATDSQSFPLLLPRIPDMARYGAYSSLKVYHPNDVRHLVRYANLRGIRVILEIDGPSHAGNGWQWGEQAGLGNLAVCINKMPWRYYCIQPPCGQLNPVNKNLYTVLFQLYQDIVDLFDEKETFHMGGDEVHLGCWNSTEEIINYLNFHGKNRSTESFMELWSEYQANALTTYDAVVGHKNSKVIVWSSALTDVNIISKFLPKDRYIIQTWVPSTDNISELLLQLGYKVIISTKDAWYLDHGFWGTTQYHGWRISYSNKLPKHSNVLGGEVCMWGELVDENSIDNRIWPRAAAAAERLWSNPDSGTAKAEQRLYRHRERLLSRGIQAEALAPRYCYQNEGECS